MGIDFFNLLVVETVLVYWYYGINVSFRDTVIHTLLFAACIFFVRVPAKVYAQIWRYGGIESYLRLIFADALAFCLDLFLNLFYHFRPVTVVHLFAISCAYLLLSISIRMIYRYAYKNGSSLTPFGRFLNFLLIFFGGEKLLNQRDSDSHKVRVAVIGAGRVGVSLVEELSDNPVTSYYPVCFVDISMDKIGREIGGLPVLADDESLHVRLRELDVQEVLFAVPQKDDKSKEELYHRYRQAGFGVKVYDYPTTYEPGAKRSLREFDIEDLLSRKQVVMQDEETDAYYQGNVILITGGGGSIGSELCRQLARMSPKQLVILDIYENGAYDVQQELRILYGNSINVAIEICSITNRAAVDRVMEFYHPDIVINAAAHKHVPLMEHNCVEAVENNVFGTLNVVESCEKYHVSGFIMVSTDKAVNPTNVMGATKRMCELIVQSFSTHSNIKYSATRFGNVLGSAGSVIPLFKKQIASGGPVTVTDRRITRYFMTIPEASQLVLQSGAIAKNGELFVLDMGHSVKIWDLAVSMVRLSGADGIEIVETGLRPGEKLYEETLLHTEELGKTRNDLIFIEKDTAISSLELDRRLDILRDACATGDDERVRAALHQVVPTYKTPEEVNAAYCNS